ncbi:MAG TPA: glycosyltransferase [Chloroflexota bacterium]
MSGERGPGVSIVIPCYNEEANLRAGTLTHVAIYAERADDVAEVLVVDDGSSDASRQLIAALATRHGKLRLLAEPHRGKAGAVVAGIMAARAEFVLFTDMDQATPIEEIEKLRPLLTEGYDVLVGSRAGHRQGAPLVRKLMASGFMLVRRLILDVGDVTDTQCGFKALRSDLARRVVGQLRVFRPGVQQASGATVTAGFDAELLFVARRLGARIREVPVNWHYVGTRRVHPLKESWRGLKSMVMVRRSQMRGDYDRPAPTTSESDTPPSGEPKTGSAPRSRSDGSRVAAP